MWSFIIYTLHQILVGQLNQGIWTGRNIYYESDKKNALRRFTRKTTMQDVTSGT